MTSSQRHHHHIDTKELPESIETAILISYRSTGLGLYGASIRFIGMPLEKIALYMNSAQVSGKNQLRQAIELTFQEQGVAGTTNATRSMMAPFKVVGPASVFAWFLQYSVMGMVFQVCDQALSSAMNVPVMPYGNQLMEDPSLDDKITTTSSSSSSSGDDGVSTPIKMGTKILLAPFLSGILESAVANRAEVQRYYGINKFSSVEASLKWNTISRLCGPAFIANASRNTIMSATSFVITPVLYRNYYPQELKSKSSLFWFGLGVNIFIGNSVAITQQALWGRALDYAINPANVQCATTAGVGSSSQQVMATNIHYKNVIRQGLEKEGTAAFITVPKWASRVMMNAPVQGTLPWFYNEILPLAEDRLIHVVRSAYTKLFVKDSYSNSTAAIKGDHHHHHDSTFHEPKATATSPIQNGKV